MASYPPEGDPLHRQTLTTALRTHWPEYLIEAWALGTFMVSAGLVGVLLGSTASPVRSLIADGDLRRAIAGVAMGLTAIMLIYSPWGRRSGAHMNPAVTLTFLFLGKTQAVDALWYVLAQFAGAIIGVSLVTLVAGSAFAGPEVYHVVTVPGPRGVGTALVAEFVISGVLMTAVLQLSARPRWARYTGCVAGFLVACFITFEAPLSGMSMNPARTLASAVAAGVWDGIAVYFAAPVAGMLSAAIVNRWLMAGMPFGCAKLDHTPDVRCIHCGYEPSTSTAPMRRLSV